MNFKKIAGTSFKNEINYILHRDYGLDPNEVEIKIELSNYQLRLIILVL